MLLIIQAIFFCVAAKSFLGEITLIGTYSVLSTSQISTAPCSLQTHLSLPIKCTNVSLQLLVEMLKAVLEVQSLRVSCETARVKAGPRETNDAP